MKPIIVGIDGSQAAIAAALWGVDEAISRAVPLRLISVIKQIHPSPDDYDRDLAHAEKSLREAQLAIEASQKPVNVETEVPRGPAGPVLGGGIPRCRDDLRRLRRHRALRPFDLGFDGNRARREGALPGRGHTHRFRPATARHQLDRGPDDRRTRQRCRRQICCVGSEVAQGAHARARRPTRRTYRSRRRRVRASGPGMGAASSRGARLPDHHQGSHRPAFSAPTTSEFSSRCISGAEAGQLARLVGPHGHPLFRHPELLGARRPALGPGPS